MWYRKNFFQYAIATLLVLLIIYLIYVLSPLLVPAFNFITTIMLPLIFAGILYYLLKPSVNYLNEKGIPRELAILIAYGVIAIFMFLVGFYVYPIISEQLASFAEGSSQKIEQVKEKTADIISFLNFKVYTPGEINKLLSEHLQKFNTLIMQNIVDIVTSITKIAVVLLITPFVLFYLLKDDHRFYELFLSNFPEEFTPEAKKLLHDIDDTLLKFINGQVLVAISVGVLLFIGFFIIGLKHALLLASFAMVFSTVPFLGSFIAAVPALLVAISMSSWMAFQVLLVMIGVHLIDANFISPVIMGQRLKIHPLTIVLLLLASGFLYGVLGLLLATPIYAIMRVCAINLYKIYRLRFRAKKEPKTET